MRVPALGRTAPSQLPSARRLNGTRGSRAGAVRATYAWADAQGRQAPCLRPVVWRGAGGGAGLRGGAAGGGRRVGR